MDAILLAHSHFRFLSLDSTEFFFLSLEYWISLTPISYLTSPQTSFKQSALNISVVLQLKGSPCDLESEDQGCTLGSET